MSQVRAVPRGGSRCPGHGGGPFLELGSGTRGASCSWQALALLPTPPSRAGAEEEEGFGPWSPWSPCSKTCTRPERPATKSRERLCSGAANCSGESFQEQPCNLPHCSGGAGAVPHCPGGPGTVPCAPARHPAAQPRVVPCPLSPCPHRRPPVPGRGLCRPELLVDAVGSVGRVLPQLRRGGAAAPACLQPPRHGGPLVPGHPQRLRAATLLQPPGL